MTHPWARRAREPTAADRAYEKWKYDQDRAKASYSDPSCPERPCDRCGTLYRGPAVYCSLACALADA